MGEKQSCCSVSRAQADLGQADQPGPEQGKGKRRAHSALLQTAQRHKTEKLKHSDTTSCFS